MTATIIGADNPRIMPDERDKEMLEERAQLRDKVSGPRVGDFLVFSGGEIHRFSHDWEERGLQTTGCHEGSFYLGKGSASYSGGLYPIVPREKILSSGKTRLGLFWFFHHGWMQAHSGVKVEITCRVFTTDLPSDHWKK